jgi:shikimate dehydrogenase
MNVTGKTTVLGVVGCPVEHSISPQLHNVMAELMSVDSVYAAFKVEKGDMENALRGMKALGIRGLNVTIPHKIDAARLCDEIDPFAEKMGACNTLVNTNSTVKGYNTDGPGFVRSLKREGVFPKGKNCVIIGAGGAAAGIAMALADEGAKIGVMNRTDEKAQALCERINKYYPQAAHRVKNARHADILINATSVGMNSDKCPFDRFDELSENCVVCDVVYCPRETVFLKKAAQHGLKTVGGIGMLINQAVIAFEYFTEKSVGEETVDYLYKMTELKKSIVLTGFMGTGKSAVARRLCRLTGAEFIDTDDEIEREEGMKISDIFARNGEKYFRDKESEVIRRLSGRSGSVISLGGGAVLRRENIDVLRKNAFVVRLKADIERVYKNIGSNTSTRPLLAGKSMEEAKKLLESREEAYKNCDWEIDVTYLEKEVTADKILEKYMSEV